MIGRAVFLFLPLFPNKKGVISLTAVSGLIDTITANLDEFYAAFRLMEFSWFSTTVRLVLSALLGGIIGYERGKHGRAAGFRTHIILCVGSALTSLCGLQFAVTLGVNADATRIAASVVSGIGFLGAGAIILKNKVTITGLTTAAGMWTTANIGIAAGAGFYSGAIVTTVIVYCATRFFTMFEKKRKAITNFYIEIENARKTNMVVEEVQKITDEIIDIQVQDAKSSIPDSVAILVAVDNSRTIADELKDKFMEIENVTFVLAQ